MADYCNFMKKLGLDKYAVCLSMHYDPFLFAVSFVACLLTPIVIGILQSVSFTYSANEANSYFLNYLLFCCDLLFVLDFYYSAKSYYEKQKSRRESKRAKR